MGPTHKRHPTPPCDAGLRSPAEADAQETAFVAFSDCVLMRNAAGREVLAADEDVESLKDLGFVACGGRGADIPRTITPPRATKPAPAPAISCKIPQTLVEIDPSSACTRRCPFCDPGIPKGRRAKRRFLSLRVHNKMINKLAAAGFDQRESQVCYCGHGEPFLHPNIIEMMRYTRRVLPNARLTAFTNGDPFRAERGVEMLCALEALDIDVLVWSVYGDRGRPDSTTREFPKQVRASSLDPGRVHVNDYVGGLEGASSRSGTVCRPRNAFRSDPCEFPSKKLFLAAEGYWLLCCEDYGQRVRFSGRLGPVELNKDRKFVSAKSLASEGRRKEGLICRVCDRCGSAPDGYRHVPLLVGSRFWPPPPPAIPKVGGRRLVVLATNWRWQDHALAAIDAIEAASTMRGRLMLLWNDDEHPKCPPALRRKNVIVKEFPGSLGWCGISRGISYALRYAVKKGYGWVVKIDTDTAILRKGWDACLCAECAPNEQIGTLMDAALVGQIPNNSDGLDDGLFMHSLAKFCRWSRGFVRQWRRRWDHIQGGCYVIGIEALRRIERVVGLGAQDQEALQDGERVGEDVYLDTKCKVAGVPQRDSMLCRIWFRMHGTGELSIEQVRHQRDNVGAVVLHPIKNLDTLRVLAEEIV